MTLAHIILFGCVVGTIVGLWTGPWWYHIRSADAGDGFFMVKDEGNQVYSVWMVPSFLMFRESLKDKNRGKVFFDKLNLMLDDLKKRYPDGDFYMVTHQKLIDWLKSKDQIMMSEPKYINKRFYFLRKLLILNLRGPLFETIPFYKVTFKFNPCWTKTTF